MGTDVANFRHEGFIVDYRRRRCGSSASVVFTRLIHMGGSHPWPYADWLWRLRGWLDGLGASHGTRMPAKSAAADTPKVGDMLNYCRVEALEPGRLLRLRSTLRAPGDGWMEWRVEEQMPGTSWLTQTAFFAPRGLPGFLYWIALGPLHRLIFRGLIEAIGRGNEAM
jgi:hypothetical protein